MSNSISFFGSYLSEHTGSIGPSELIANELKSEGHQTRLVSTNKHFLLRFFTSLYTAFSQKADISFMDIYSSRVILQSYIISKILTYRREKYIAVLHGGGILDRYPVIKKYLEPILQNSQTVISPSLYLQDGLSKHGLKVHYLPNPLNLAIFPYERGHVEKFKLLWVRAFDKIYNPWLAIETLVRVHKKFPEISMTMIGPDMGELNATKRLAEKYGILKLIEFVGSVPNDQLFTYYQSHSVYLNTTSYESFGAAVCEAAATGIPVVSTNVGEIPFLWHDRESILLVKDFSSKQMADCVIDLLNNPELSQKLSVNARQIAEEFSLSEIKLKWLDLINQFTIT